MKSKLVKIAILTFIMLILINIIPVISIKCQAIDSVTEDLEFWRPGEVEIPDSVENKVQNILEVISIIGIVTSVITLIIIGFKFMTGSVEEKAEYKKSLIPWIIGTILVASVSTLPLLIYNAVESFDENNGAAQTTLSLDKTSVTLKMGEVDEITLIATVTSNEERKVVWKSSNSKVATVDSNGKVTAVSEGTAIITVYTAGNQESCTVTVKAPRTASITISKNSLTLNAPKERTYQLTATITPINSIDPVYWSSSNNDVVTVDSNGKIKVVSEGTATITATSGTKSANCTVQINSEKIREVQYYNPTTQTVSTTKTSNEDMGYWIYMPDISMVKDVEKLPLIIFLHGSGEVRRRYK